MEILEIVLNCPKCDKTFSCYGPFPGWPQKSTKVTINFSCPGCGDNATTDLWRGPNDEVLTLPPANTN